MFHPQQRRELFFAGATAKGIPRLSKACMFQHFGKKCRLQRLRCGTHLVQTRLGHCRAGRGRAQKKICHGNSSHSIDVT